MPKREPKLPMMAKLPATVEEADALLFARDLITRLSGAGSAGSPFEAAESRYMLRKCLGAALQTANGRMWLIEQARNGEEESRIVLRDAILEMKSRHVELPTELEFYNMQVVRGDITPPLRWQGPKKKNELTRNVCIAIVVAGVVGRFGLKPTGSSARRRSACSIVGEALEAVGMRLGYEAIKTIWNEYRRFMPTAPAFWNSLYT
jgi:hypothetical protein